MRMMGLPVEKRRFSTGEADCRTSDVPQAQVPILAVGDGLNIRMDGGSCIDSLAELPAIQQCGLPTTIKTTQNPPILFAVVKHQPEGVYAVRQSVISHRACCCRVLNLSILAHKEAISNKKRTEYASRGLQRKTKSSWLLDRICALRSRPRWLWTRRGLLLKMMPGVEIERCLWPSQPHPTGSHSKYEVLVNNLAPPVLKYLGRGCLAEDPCLPASELCRYRRAGSKSRP